MSLRFRQTFTLFPGVRLNIGKRGISASIGMPGATVNVGKKGVIRCYTPRITQDLLPPVYCLSARLPDLLKTD